MLSKVTECKYKVIRIGQSIYIVWTKDKPLIIRLKEIKYYPLVVKHIGELREENYKKHNISFGGHLTELAKIRDEAVKSKSYSAATNAEKARGAVGGLYIEQKIIRTGKIEDLSEDELNERINTIVSDNSLLLDKKEENKTPQEKKPKPILS